MGRTISIAYSRYCGDHEIEGQHVSVKLIFLPFRFHIFDTPTQVLKHYPQARKNMAKHERWENKEEESLEPDAYLEEVFKVFGDSTSLFDDLQNSKKTRELDQFVHSSNPRNSCNLIPTFKDLVKW